MKVLLNSDCKEKKLVSVIGSHGLGVFFRKGIHSTYVNSQGSSFNVSLSLSDILKECEERTPVYEGDKITLEF